MEFIKDSQPGRRLSQQVVCQKDPAIDQDLPEDAGLHVPASGDNHRFRDEPQPPAEAQPVGKDQVLQDRNLRKPSQFEEVIPVHEDPVRPHHPAHAGKKQVIQPPSVPSKERGGGLVSLEETPTYGSFFDHGSNPRDRIRRKHHVRMREEQNLSCGSPAAGVHLTRPASGHPEEGHSRSGPGHPIGPIPRAPINDQKLIRSEAGQMREGAANEIALIEDRENN